MRARKHPLLAGFYATFLSLAAPMFLLVHTPSPKVIQRRVTALQQLSYYVEARETKDCSFLSVSPGLAGSAGAALVALVVLVARLQAFSEMSETPVIQSSA